MAQRQNQESNSSQNISELIQQTKRLTSTMSDKQILQKAKEHLEDALAYRNPRPQAFWNKNKSFTIRISYLVRASSIWRWLLFILSYTYMYLIILEQHNLSLKSILEIISLMIFWSDVVLQLHYKQPDKIKIQSKYDNKFYLRLFVIIILTFEQLMILGLDDYYKKYTLLMRITRAILPICYDAFIYKTFWALLWCYKDILNYLLFYTMIIVGFSVAANQIIQISPGTTYDDFRQNYGDLSKLIFVIYIMSSYDAYPDNQHVALHSSIFNYAFFIVFIFFNVFFFVVIPASIIFNSFRETRSKILLIDQIKQKDSLILCFSTLRRNKQNVSKDFFVKFLVFVYNSNIKYVKCVREICKRIIPNEYSQIELKEFLQLCNIIQSDSKMNLPKYSSWYIWTKIRQYANEQLNLQYCIQSNIFRIINLILITGTFINCLLYFSTRQTIFYQIDNILVAAFFVEVCIKIVGLGAQKYFKDKWNAFDFGLLSFIFILELLPNHLIPQRSDIIIKMIRIFRVTTLVQHIFHNPKPIKQGKINTIQQLLGQMASIIPIVLKFFPLFMITYYILGVIGMQAFINQTKIKPQQSPYSFYDKYSNFHSLMATQFIMVQILVEAGWSMVAFDHAYRYSSYYWVMIYFVGCHVITVLILSALMKGLVWEVYCTIQQQYQRRLQIRNQSQRQHTSINQRILEYETIKTLINTNVMFKPNTIMKKKLFEDKKDQQIIQQMKAMIKLFKSQTKKSFLQKRSMSIKQIQNLISLWQNAQLHPYEINQNSQDFQDHFNSYNIQDNQEALQRKIKTLLKDFNPDFNGTLQLKPVSEKFLKHINQKLKQKIYSQSQDQQKKRSSKRLINSINQMLKIQKSQRFLKYEILKSFNTTKSLQNYAIDNIKLLANSSQQPPNTYQVIKQTLTNQNQLLLTEKFEYKYLKDVYGSQFPQLQEFKMQNLRKKESKLLYCLSSILKEQMINLNDFFKILTTVQQQISDQLLIKGSICKFLFEMNGQPYNRWFCIQVKLSGFIEIHFLKTNQWINTQSLNQNNVYFGKNIFDCSQDETTNCPVKQLYSSMGNFYGNFVTLALSLKNNKPFFKTDPNHNAYNLYCFYIGVDNFNHSEKLNISKVMLVCLTKDKPINLPYIVRNDIEEQNQNMLVKQKLDLDKTQYEIFTKLQNLENQQEEQQMLEHFSHHQILNLLSSIKDIINFYPKTLIQKVEKVLNDNFNYA